jgi:hypothetical protein
MDEAKNCLKIAMLLSDVWAVGPVLVKWAQE